MSSTPNTSVGKPAQGRDDTKRQNKPNDQARPNKDAQKRPGSNPANGQGSQFGKDDQSKKGAQGAQSAESDVTLESAPPKRSDSKSATAGSKDQTNMKSRPEAGDTDDERTGQVAGKNSNSASGARGDQPDSRRN